MCWSAGLPAGSRPTSTLPRPCHWLSVCPPRPLLTPRPADSTRPTRPPSKFPQPSSESDIPMLTTQLTHPTLLAALAAAGHGSKVLIADSNYPHATAHGPNAQVVHLNLSRGLVNGPDVLTAITSVIKVESAAVMAPGTDLLPVHEEYRQLLGADVPLEIRATISRGTSAPSTCRYSSWTGSRSVPGAITAALSTVITLVIAVSTSGPFTRPRLRFRWTTWALGPWAVAWG